MQNLSTGTMSHRILLVDDEIDILEFVRYNLLKEGYEVFTAQNGAEALKAAAECRPHLILLDMMMPVMDLSLIHISPGWPSAAPYSPAAR